MIPLVQKVAGWFLKRRIEHVEQFMRHPHETQERVFHELIEKARHTRWGSHHGYEDIHTIDQFRSQVPVSPYETLFPWIEMELKGESDILWPGRTQWFARSSGTTNDKSKYIPVSQESLDECHYKAGQDMLAVYFHNKPDSKLFTGKSLSIGGSHTSSPLSKHARCGDVSAVILENLPSFYEMVRAPSKEVALMPNWEEKLPVMAREVLNDDVTALVGVPTWTLALIHRLLDEAKISSRNLLEIWPNLELYVHGGVNFEPYRSQFESLIPSSFMSYLDCYNASEGFFGFQHERDQRDLLLLLDYGIFYEFIPVEDLDQEHPRTYVLGEVETGKNYAMLISTNAGLWRYLIGDTLVFTSTAPYTVRVTGRTKQFINLFGEELMVDNAEVALSEACRQTGAQIENFTVGPVFPEQSVQGGHEWLIEFSVMPDSLDHFRSLLDRQLKELNSDYEAKRVGDIALRPPRIVVLPQGTFHEWMKKRGKLGGQHKVPRLANHRQYVDDILAMPALRV